MDLIATRRFTYATRRLLPGDRFVAADRIARVLIAVRRAEQAPPEEPKEIPPQDTLSMLRAEYERVLGKRVYHGWDEDELRAKIAAAKED